MTRPSPAGVPPIITGAGEILQRYEVLFCDVWGVVHNGVRAYIAAVEALERFRAAGGSVILLTNAPVPIHRVEAMLEARRVPPLAYDTIVSSGEIALQHIREAGYRKAHCIGPRERDAAFFARAGAIDVPLDQAEAIFCTGLTDDVNETVESYRAVLDEGVRRGLPFVCANPDLVVDVGGRLFLCAGALADAYQHQGGKVYWAGKPHASAYATARAAAARLRGATPADDKILVIGDAIRTDLAGAKGAGLDALFVAGGIHRDEAMDGDRVDPEKLAALFTPGTPPALAAMGALAW
jgi:HAD superfamily hydrolase (TIGR01459 family)